MTAVSLVDHKVDDNVVDDKVVDDKMGDCKVSFAGLSGHTEVHFRPCSLPPEFLLDLESHLKTRFLRILGEIGSGGNGCVILARCTCSGTLEACFFRQFGERASCDELTAIKVSKRGSNVREGAAWKALSAATELELESLEGSIIPSVYLVELRNLFKSKCGAPPPAPPAPPTGFTLAEPTQATSTQTTSPTQATPTRTTPPRATKPAKPAKPTPIDLTSPHQTRASKSFLGKRNNEEMISQTAQKQTTKKLRSRWYTVAGTKWRKRQPQVDSSLTARSTSPSSMSTSSLSQSESLVSKSEVESSSKEDLKMKKPGTQAVAVSDYLLVYTELGVNSDGYFKLLEDLTPEALAYAILLHLNVLRCLHERGLSHNDINPRNFVYVKFRDALVPKLVDFESLDFMDSHLGDCETIGGLCPHRHFHSDSHPAKLDKDKNPAFVPQGGTCFSQAYCFLETTVSFASPEQIAGVIQALLCRCTCCYPFNLDKAKSDVYSMGLSVLELERKMPMLRAGRYAPKVCADMCKSDCQQSDALVKLLRQFLHQRQLDIDEALTKYAESARNAEEAKFMNMRSEILKAALDPDPKSRISMHVFYTRWLATLSKGQHALQCTEPLDVGGVFDISASKRQMLRAALHQGLFDRLLICLLLQDKQDQPLKNHTPTKDRPVQDKVSTSKGKKVAQENKSKIQLLPWKNARSSLLKSRWARITGNPASLLDARVFCHATLMVELYFAEVLRVLEACAKAEIHLQCCIDSTLDLDLRDSTDDLKEKLTNDKLTKEKLTKSGGCQHPPVLCLVIYMTDFDIVWTASVRISYALRCSAWRCFNMENAIRHLRTIYPQYSNRHIINLYSWLLDIAVPFVMQTDSFGRILNNFLETGKIKHGKVKEDSKDCVTDVEEGKWLQVGRVPQTRQLTPEQRDSVWRFVVETVCSQSFFGHESRIIKAAVANLFK